MAMRGTALGRVSLLRKLSRRKRRDWMEEEEGEERWGEEDDVEETPVPRGVSSPDEPTQ